MLNHPDSVADLSALIKAERRYWMLDAGYLMCGCGLRARSMLNHPDSVADLSALIKAERRYWIMDAGYWILDVWVWD
jgi:hypothetical protein